MKVSCFLCESSERIYDDSFTAKRLRNRPLTTYMCQVCHERITQKTVRRKNEGKLQPQLFHTGNRW